MKMHLNLIHRFARGPGKRTFGKALLAFLAGAALNAQATTIDVGGLGTIGDSTLTTTTGVAFVPNSGALWAAAGGDGVKYSHLNSRTLTVPTAGAVTLKFSHRYNFEDAWDGGAVYVSVNGGTPTYVPDGSFSANGYVKVLDSSSYDGGPFPGLEKVFTGQSADWGTPAYVESVATLGTFAAGDTIAIEFRGAWDWAGSPAAPNWEISKVEVRDSANTAMLNADFINGATGFSVTSDLGLAGPWTYAGTDTCRFELNATTSTADRFVPSTPGVIDLNNAKLEVAVLEGTLTPGQTFSLFNLSGGSTLQGAYGSITLPTGAWDLSGLQPGGNGQITLLASSTWLQTAAGTFNWDDPLNWTDGLIPNAAAITANLNIDYVGTQTIDLNQPTTVAAINLGDSTGTTKYGVTIAAGTSGSLTMDASSGSAAITRTNGNGVSDTISANIQLNDNLAISDATGNLDWGTINGIRITGTISGNASITKSGNGSLSLEAANSFDGGVTITNGYLQIRNATALGSGPFAIGTPANTAPIPWINMHNGAAVTIANTVVLNGNFISHQGFTCTGPVKLARTGIMARCNLDASGVVTDLDGNNTLNGLDLNLSGVGGWGGTLILRAPITMYGNQVMTHDSDWGDSGTFGANIAGAIGDGGHGYSLTKAGNAGTFLSGANTYTGDTIVQSGKLFLNSTGSLAIKVTDAGCNKLTGPAKLELNGSLNIDTSAVTVNAGSWTVIDVGSFSSLTFGGTFNVPGFTKSGSMWTKTDGGTTWIFNQSTGVLSLPVAWILTFNYGISSGVIDQTTTPRTIVLHVPNGTDLATLNPTFTVNSGTCNQTSGSPPTPTFASANPVTYTVTDGATVNNYSVTVIVDPPAPGGVGANLALWLDASDASTMTFDPVVTTTVTEWRDRFGSSNKATTRGGAPTLVASGINEIPTVHFNTSAWMNDGVNRSAGPVTVFLVARETGGSNARVLGAANNWLFGYWGGKYNEFHFDGWVTDAGPAANTNPHVHVATIPGSGSATTVWGDSVLLASNTGGTTGPNNLQLNGWSNGANETSDCDISEVIVYDRVLSAPELTAVNTYLNTKYGTTPPPTWTWIKATAPGTYDWTSANWDAPDYPNGQGVLAKCFTQAGNNRWTVPSPSITLGQLALGGDGGAMHTLQGPGTLIFDNGTKHASLSRGNVSTTTNGYIEVAGITLNSILDIDLPYAFVSPFTISSPISGAAGLNIVSAAGNFPSEGWFGLILSGANTYTGDTVVGSASWVDMAGSMKFKVTDSGSNKVTGPGTIRFSGSLVIDTSAVTVSVGKWTLIDASTLKDYYGTSFNVTGFTKNGSLWTKTDGSRTWVFNQTTGELSLPAAWIMSFNYGSYPGIINQTAKTIDLRVPAGTDLATLNPTFTLNSGVCNQTSGSPPSPTFAAQNPVTYTVIDGATENNYVVTVTLVVLPPVTNGLVRYYDASQLIGVTDGSPVSTWPDLSGNFADATVPTGNASPTYVADAGTGTGKPALYFPMNTNATNSGALGFTRATNIRTVFMVFKGASFLLTDTNAYPFHRSEAAGGTDTDPTFGLWGNDASASVTGGATRVNGSATYPGGASTSTVNLGTGTMPTSLGNGFNLIEVVTTGNVQADSFNKDRVYHSGNQYHAEVLIYNRVLSEMERWQVGGYLTAKYGLTTTYPGPASILYFGIPGSTGVIDHTLKTINLAVPWGTDLVTLNPTFVLSSGTCDQTSGSPPTPSFAVQNPATYTVTDGATVNPYTVTVTVLPPSTAADILTFDFGSYGLGVINGTNINLTVPQGTSVSALAPTYTKSPYSNCVPASGSTQDFTAPVHYVVTAQDGTTIKDYTVTVSVSPASIKVAGSLLIDLHHARGVVTATGIEVSQTSVTNWVNYGTLGGSFLRVTDSPYASSMGSGYFTPPNLLTKGGIAAPSAPGSRMLVSSIATPPALQGSHPYSIEVWLWKNNTAGDQRGVFAWTENGPPTGDAGKLCAGDPVALHNNGKDLNWNGLPSANAWHHVALTYDGTTEKIYLDGSLQNSAAKTLNINSGTYYPMLFSGIISAAPYQTSFSLNGSIGAVRVHSAALTAADVAANNTAGIGAVGAEQGSAYDTWAATYAGGQAANLDYNNDGVANGIAYFMGKNGLATNPGVVDGKVTWPRVNPVASFVVEVSDNLADWVPATTGVDTSDPSKVVFTLPSGAAKQFCRLVVTP